MTLFVLVIMFCCMSMALSLFYVTKALYSIATTLRERHD